MDLEISKATLSDARTVAALALATFYETYVLTDDPSDLAEYVTTTFSVEKCVDQLSSSSNTFFLAAVGGGFVGYAKIRRGAMPEAIKGENLLEIERIYLLSKFAGKGIGRKLIERCFEVAQAENYDGVWLGVWDENLSANQFYLGLGFEKAGETDFHYGTETFTNEVMVKRFA